MTRKYRRPLVALLIALGVVATATLGSAATLTVNAATISAFTVTNPCDGTATATAEDRQGAKKFRDVRVVLPASCGGRLQVAVIEGGTLIRSYDGSVSTGWVLLDNISGGYRPEDIAVVATLDGWHLPISWSFPP